MSSPPVERAGNTALAGEATPRDGDEVRSRSAGAGADNAAVRTPVPLAAPDSVGPVAVLGVVEDGATSAAVVNGGALGRQQPNNLACDQRGHDDLAHEGGGDGARMDPRLAAAAGLNGRGRGVARRRRGGEVRRVSRTSPEAELRRPSTDRRRREVCRGESRLGAAAACGWVPRRRVAGHIGGSSPWLRWAKKRRKNGDGRERAPGR
jgi:hypothetical protein